MTRMLLVYLDPIEFVKNVQIRLRMRAYETINLSWAAKDPQTTQERKHMTFELGKPPVKKTRRRSEGSVEMQRANASQGKEPSLRASIY